MNDSASELESNFDSQVESNAVNQAEQNADARFDVLEQVTFRLAEGVGESDFLAAMQPVQAWISAQPGFVYRTLCLHEESGEWADLVYWATMADAQAASALFMQQQACVNWVGMIDRDSIRMQHSQVRFAQAGTAA